MNNSKSQVSSSQDQEADTSKNIKKITKKKNYKNTTKIVINISDCQYPVVTKVAKKFGWKLQSTSETMDWDICWTDNAVQPETLSKMELHQKINHFPGMYNLARKNLLGRGLMKMKKKFPNDYNFFPMTWMLPVQYHELKAYFETKAKGKARTFIVKPQCLSQGKGIFLTRKLQNINPSNHCVVQRYLHKPYLIDGLKFDLRVYVLVASVDPLTIYLYEQGLGRLATQKYEAPNRQNMQQVCMHLTNYAINKDNPKFIFNESQKDMSKGHKRSLTSVYELLQTHGVNINELKTKIKDCIIKTMISGLPHLTNTYRSCQPESYAANMCFQLLGFDVMLNDKAEPIILEINHTPSFTTDTPLDQFIKFNYIKDALTIMNITEKIKNDIIRQQKQSCQQRVLTGKKIKLTVTEKQGKKNEQVKRKLQFQKSNMGRFERIYPTDAEIDPYKQFMDYAQENFQISMGNKKVLKKTEKNDEVKITTVTKPKARRPQTLSTTPDLLKRTIGQRKYQTKQSLNQVQYQNFQYKLSSSAQQDNIEDRFVSIHPNSLLNRQKNEDFLKEEKHQFIEHLYSKSPQEHYKAPSTFTMKDISYSKETIRPREYKSINKFLKRADINSEKAIINSKIPLTNKALLKQKIPIALNTLLIDGIEQHQHNNFIIGNFKKNLITKN